MYTSYTLQWFAGFDVLDFHRMTTISIEDIEWLSMGSSPVRISDG